MSVAKKLFRKEAASQLRICPRNTEKIQLEFLCFCASVASHFPSFAEKKNLPAFEKKSSG